MVFLHGRPVFLPQLANQRVQTGAAGLFHHIPIFGSATALGFVPAGSGVVVLHENQLYHERRRGWRKGLDARPKG
jgi:hypothetical protein